MIFDYISGKCLTGTERRAEELDYEVLNKFVGMELYPGTFNIQLDADIPCYRLSPSIMTDRYSLFIVGVGTDRHINKGLLPVPGWLLFDAENPIPRHFVEVISIFNIRKKLKIEKWPSVSVKLALQLENHR